MTRFTLTLKTPYKEAKKQAAKNDSIFQKSYWYLIYKNKEE